jgi:hypothetical protein
MNFVAPSRAERMRWLSTITAHLQRKPTAGADAPADANAPANAPALDEATLHVLAELPVVWELWSAQGKRDEAAARYAELSRLAPTCWQLMQDRGNYFMDVGKYRRAEVARTSSKSARPASAPRMRVRAQLCACRADDAWFPEHMETAELRSC